VSLYTAGVWTVRPGREEEFVELWADLAEWTAAAFAGRSGTLLRDREHPNRFLSFGSWESADQIDAWRAAPKWEEVVGRMRELLEDFQPGVYDVAARVGG
jgi:heme-degrading monooxygenase HmoA